MDNKSSIDSSVKNDEIIDFFENVSIESRNSFLTKAEVLNITPKEVVVKITDKFSSTIQLNELKNISDLKVGTTFDVYVEKLENKNGQIVVSRSKAEVVKKWQTMYTSLNEGVILNGLITEKLTGGLNVDINGIPCFLPGSQIEMKNIEDYDSYLGKDIDVIVTKINKKTNNVIVSHKLIIENSIKEQERILISQIEKGQIVEGIVSSMTPYGAFINIGGVSGLLHITDISWTRINHPNEVLQIGQKIKVVVTELDSKNQKLSFGLKHLTPSPWDQITEDKIKIGDVVTGKVVNIVDYGAFIEIFPGVEGLLHVSDLCWKSRTPKVNSILSLEKSIEVKIIDVNIAEKKISCGLKQLTENPWVTFENEFSVGSLHEGTVIKKVIRGFFVDFGHGIEGFVSKFDIPKKINLTVGQKEQFKVKEYDKDNFKLTVMHKDYAESENKTLKGSFSTNRKTTLGDVLKNNI